MHTYRRLRVRVATATRPRTVIGIRADVQTRERPRRRVMRHSYSRQASPHSRPLPAGDSMIPTSLIAAEASVLGAERQCIIMQAAGHILSRPGLAGCAIVADYRVPPA